MKKIIILIWMFIGAIFCVNAQQKGFTSAEWVQAGFALNGENDFKAAAFVLAPGYAFNDRWFLRLQAEGSIDLFHIDHDKTYRTNVLLGLSVGFNIISTKYDLLDVTATVGNTLRTKVWDYTFYDIGVHWSANNYKNKPMVGIGVRHYGSRTDNFDKYWNLYVCLGVRFN